MCRKHSAVFGEWNTSPTNGNANTPVDVLCFDTPGRLKPHPESYLQLHCPEKSLHLRRGSGLGTQALPEGPAAEAKPIGCFPHRAALCRGSCTDYCSISRPAGRAGRQLRNHEVTLTKLRHAGLRNPKAMLPPEVPIISCMKTAQKNSPEKLNPSGTSVLRLRSQARIGALGASAPASRRGPPTCIALEHMFAAGWGLARRIRRVL